MKLILSSELLKVAADKHGNIVSAVYEGNGSEEEVRDSDKTKRQNTRLKSKKVQCL
jgi:hypothetical protein